jgi:hypothetical protein
MRASRLQVLISKPHPGLDGGLTAFAGVRIKKNLRRILRLMGKDVSSLVKMVDLGSAGAMAGIGTDKRREPRLLTPEPVWPDFGGCG